MKTLLFLTAILGVLSASAREKKLVYHVNSKVKYDYELSDNKLDGNFSSYYETGRLRVKGQFSNNHKTGRWRYWDENGNLRAERIYENNFRYSVVKEMDADGSKFQSLDSSEAGEDCRVVNYFFMHTHISHINLQQNCNGELFENFLQILYRNYSEGKYPLFGHEELENSKEAECIPGASQITSILIKENYHWCSGEQTLNNKILAICLVAEKNGVQQQLGWIKAEDLNDKELLKLLRSHHYASAIIKSTVVDPFSGLKEVKDSDMVKLMMIDLEAGAILYRIDHADALANLRIYPSSVPFQD